MKSLMNKEESLTVLFVVFPNTNRAMLFVQMKFPAQITPCPQCGSGNICACPGGTCWKPLEGINWLCKDCLYEW